MSPLSDTCTLASSVVGIDLFEHIRNMMYTTVPAWLITAGLFWYFSGQTGTGDLGQVTLLQSQLVDSGLVHGYAVLPFVVLVVVAIRRKWESRSVKMGIDLKGFKPLFRSHFNWF